MFVSHFKILRFEQLTTGLFMKTLEYIDQALEYAKLSKAQIDEVVLVGGSTRIPKIRNLIQEYFSQFMGTVIEGSGSC